MRYRQNIDTPMLAGDDRGRLWFAALHPLDDLVEEVLGGRPRGPFTDFLYNTPFTEVYTDSGSRVHGRHPGCCVVDLFTYALNPSEHRIISMKVTRSIAAEWGRVESGGHYDTRLERARSRTPESFIPESRFGASGMPDIALIRFRVDEEGIDFGSGGWSMHSAQLLAFALRALYDRALDPRVHSFSFPLRTAMGDLTHEGFVPYADVARYFYELPRRSYSG